MRNLTRHLILFARVVQKNRQPADPKKSAGSGSTPVFLCFLVAFCLLAPPVGSVTTGHLPAPTINAAAAVLYDLETDTLLFEKNSDQVIPPASMLKLMAIHLAYRAIEQGKTDKDAYVTISRAASFKSAPPHSSLMFLEEGQKVTLLELMRGLAIPSGNDAGVALAEHLVGSEAAFVESMNREAARMGLEQTRFADASGYSDKNQTTAAEFARFCAIYLKENPESLSELHNLTDFTYPLKHNLAVSGRSALGPIKQYNHNSLVDRLAGVDGLKTGYIDESGFNLAITASRDNRRLLAVLMGGPGRNAGDGNLRRAVDATELMAYGFYYFTTMTPPVPNLTPLRVYGGDKTHVDLIVQPAPPICLPRHLAEGLQTVVVLDERLIAPQTLGAEVGRVEYLSANGETILATAVTLGQSVGPGNWWRRFIDSVILFFYGA